MRRDGRADEGAGLENRYGRKFIVGSNPTLSAIIQVNISGRYLHLSNGKSMARSNAATVREYLNELAPERREQMATVRQVVLENLPEGYQEAMNWGMISWEIPLARYPDTYNGQPLMYAALASQKNYMSLYLMCVYSHDDTRTDFEMRFKESGKKLNMGKSCVRFKKVEDLPMDLIADTISSTSVDDYIQSYEAARKRK